VVPECVSVVHGELVGGTCEVVVQGVVVFW
jgi:hypothetical protein